MGKPPILNRRSWWSDSGWILTPIVENWNDRHWCGFPSGWQINVKTTGRILISSPGVKETSTANLSGRLALFKHMEREMRARENTEAIVEDEDENDEEDHERRALRVSYSGRHGNCDEVGP